MVFVIWSTHQSNIRVWLRKSDPRTLRLFCGPLPCPGCMWVLWKGEVAATIACKRDHHKHSKGLRLDFLYTDQRCNPPGSWVCCFSTLGVASFATAQEAASFPLQSRQKKKKKKKQHTPVRLHNINLLDVTHSLISRNPRKPVVRGLDLVSYRHVFLPCIMGFDDKLNHQSSHSTCLDALRCYRCNVLLLLLRCSFRVIS